MHQITRGTEATHLPENYGPQGWLEHQPLCVCCGVGGGSAYGRRAGLDFMKPPVSVTVALILIAAGLLAAAYLSRSGSVTAAAVAVTCYSLGFLAAWAALRE